MAGFLLVKVVGEVTAPCIAYLNIRLRRVASCNGIPCVGLQVLQGAQDGGVEATQKILVSAAHHVVMKEHWMIGLHCQIEDLRRGVNGVHNWEIRQDLFGEIHHRNASEDVQTIVVCL